MAVILIITAISFVNKEKGRYKLPETVLGAALGPVQGIVQGLSNRLKGTLEGIAELKHLREKNRLLKEELEQKEFMYSLLLELKAENARLLKLLDLREMIPEFETIAARVIAREPSNWYNAITINVGSRQGIEVDMPVITHRGLVRRVIRGPQPSPSPSAFRPAQFCGGMIRKPGNQELSKALPVKKKTYVCFTYPGGEDTGWGQCGYIGFGGFPQGPKIGSVIEVKAEDMACPSMPSSRLLLIFITWKKCWLFAVKVKKR